MLTKRLFLTLSTAAFAALAPLSVAAQERLSVVATTGMIADAARQVGGELVEVTALMGPGVDPHVWMNPNLWSRVVLATRDAMIAAHPEGAEVFTANAAAHLDELAELAVYSQTVLASVPAESRVLVSAHDAFNYFGAAYGFEVVGIQGISTESEAGLQRVAELVDMLVARDIRAVFVESSVSDRNIRALIEGAAAQGHEVVIGGELFSDAMGAPGSYEGTYLGMIDHNVTVISRALGGQAPQGGRIDELAMN
jgi:manganese/zinc/iron transport system substrate-binding protein